MEATGLRGQLARADLCLTGEGSLDAQSTAGKVPVRVAQEAAALGVPTVVLAGRLDATFETCPPPGIVAAVPIVRGVTDTATALADGEENLERATAMVCRLVAVSASAHAWAKPPETPAAPEPRTTLELEGSDRRAGR